MTNAEYKNLLKLKENILTEMIKDCAANMANQALEPSDRTLESTIKSRLESKVSTVKWCRLQAENL